MSINQMNQIKMNQNQMNLNQMNLNKMNQIQMNQNQFNINQMKLNQMNQIQMNLNQMNQNQFNQNQMNQNQFNQNQMNLNKMNQNQFNQNKMNQNQMNQNKMNQKIGINNYQNNLNYNNFNQMNENQFKIIQKQNKEHPSFNNIDFNQFPVNNSVNNNNALMMNKNDPIKNECYAGNPKPMPESVSNNLYNSITRIRLNSGVNGTGFFMRIKIKNKEMKSLLTCKHVINQNDIDNKITINLYYGPKDNEILRQINLDKNIRIMKAFDVDVTLIEIIENDNISKDKYLIANLSYEYGYEIFKDKCNKYLSYLTA